MSAELILFVLFAAAAVAGAVNLIVQRHPIHSALSLIVVMAALAALYLLLGAEFVAAVQVIVYAGAIMVLFVFVIMLLNAGVEQRTNLSGMARYVGVPAAVVFGATLVWRLAQGSLALGASPGMEQPVETRKLAVMLFTDYVLPFELTSVLILIAILGAVVLAKRD